MPTVAVPTSCACPGASQGGVQGQPENTSLPALPNAAIVASKEEEGERQRAGERGQASEGSKSGSSGIGTAVEQVELRGSRKQPSEGGGMRVAGEQAFRGSGGSKGRRELWDGYMRAASAGEGDGGVGTAVSGRCFEGVKKAIKSGSQTAGSMNEGSGGSKGCMNVGSSVKECRMRRLLDQQAELAACDGKRGSGARREGKQAGKQEVVKVRKRMRYDKAIAELQNEVATSQARLAQVASEVSAASRPTSVPEQQQTSETCAHKGDAADDSVPVIAVRGEGVRASRAASGSGARGSDGKDQIVAATAAAPPPAAQLHGITPVEWHGSDQAPRATAPVQQQQQQVQALQESELEPACAEAGAEAGAGAGGDGDSSEGEGERDEVDEAIRCCQQAAMLWQASMGRSREETEALWGGAVALGLVRPEGPGGTGAAASNLLSADEIKQLHEVGGWLAGWVGWCMGCC